MLRAFERWEQYRLGTNIRAWLYTILRNTFINDYRRKVKQGYIIRQMPATEYTLDAVSTFTADNSLQAKETWRLIMQLPQIFRNPFILYFEGYKYQEIAEMLNEPLGTIKSRIHFARKLLKLQVER